LAEWGFSFAELIKRKDMEITMEMLSKLQKKESTFSETSNKVNLNTVYCDSYNCYRGFYLYVSHFNYLPNNDYLHDINCNKANNWFLEKYKHEINDCHYFKRYINSSNKTELDDVYYFLDEDLLVYFNINRNRVTFLFRNTQTTKIIDIVEGIKLFKKRKNSFVKPEISLLINSNNGGFATKSMKITKPKLSIVDNYNCDFIGVHQTIVKRLSKKFDKGLVLLHGKPGTGKTSYIRYLITTLKKKVIFLPPNMASAITNPVLISILIENPNSIFVIEDAENIVIDREQNGASPVSTLLNISDGLLADCLNIQLICSFNTDISKIDSALLRKGRLIAQYEFKELEISKAQSLSCKLGFDSIITSPMTLTEIYNQHDKDFTKQKQRAAIGFRVA